MRRPTTILAAAAALLLTPTLASEDFTSYLTTFTTTVTVSRVVETTTATRPYITSARVKALEEATVAAVSVSESFNGTAGAMPTGGLSLNATESLSSSATAVVTSATTTIGEERGEETGAAGRVRGEGGVWVWGLGMGVMGALIV